MAGRKTKLTPELQARFIQAISLGSTKLLACQYAGIDPATLYDWLNLGETGRAPYHDFSNAVKAAEGTAVVGWLAKIEKAASDGNWQAAAWKLERRYPRDYGRTVQEHTGADGGPVQTEIRVVYADEREAKA